MDLTDRQQQAANVLWQVLGEASVSPRGYWKTVVAKYFSDSAVDGVIELGTDPAGRAALDRIVTESLPQPTKPAAAMKPLRKRGATSKKPKPAPKD